MPGVRVPEECQLLPLLDHDVRLRLGAAHIVDECNWAFLVQQENVLRERSMQLQSPGELIPMCLPQQRLVRDHE